MAWIRILIRVIPVRFIQLMRTSTSVEVTHKTFPSFTGRWWFLPCQNSLLVRTRSRRTATFEGRRNRLLLLGRLLLPRQRHPTWTRSRAFLTKTAQLYLVVEKSSSLSSTVTVTYFWREMSSRFLVPSQWSVGLAFCSARSGGPLFPTRSGDIAALVRPCCALALPRLSSSCKLGNRG